MTLVWVTKVKTKNFLQDFGAKLKNIIGGTIKTWEDMVDETIRECNIKFEVLYPKAKNKKLQITELHDQSISVTLYGEQ